MGMQIKIVAVDNEWTELKEKEITEYTDKKQEKGKKVHLWLWSIFSLYVAKCNLVKVNLKLMLPVVSPSLHMMCGGAPWSSQGQTTYSLSL